MRCRVGPTLGLAAGCSVFIIFIEPVFCAEIDAGSKISAVTVYPDGASITRTIEVDLPNGANTLLIRQLPATVEANSVRLEGIADGSATLTSVDVKPVAGNPAATADPERTTKLARLKSDQARLAGQVEAMEAQKAAVQRFAQTGPDKLGADGKAMDVADWPKAWSAIGEGMQAINERLCVLDDQTTHVKAEIDALERAGADATGSGLPTSEVRLAIETKEAQHATLTLRYQVRGASWTPLYDAALTTLDRSKPSLTLSRRAKVRQQTGEDWKDVTLALSTVQVNRRTSAPSVETSALTLAEPDAVIDALTRNDANKPAAPRSQNERGAQTPNLAEGFVARGAYAKVQPAQASIDAGPYQVSFGIKGTVSVPQDGSEKSLTIGSAAVDPEVLVKTAPSLDTTAYIEAGFVNEDEAPLLAGDVMLHRDGVFVGRASLSLTAPGDKAALGFGADDAVKVTRVAIRKRENDGGPTGAMRSDVQDYKTTLVNRHPFVVRVTMVDGLPVSESAAVTVEPLATNTPPTEKIVDDKRGVMRWTYELKPGETREVRLGRRIRWPADRDLLFAGSKQQFRFGGGSTF